MDSLKSTNIDNYLSGRMSPEEATTFEKMIEGDAVLQKEVQSEQQVINAIQNYRKTQLKTRLSSIDVSTGWAGMPDTASLVKALSGAVITASIGTTIYLATSDKEIESTPINAIEFGYPVAEEEIIFTLPTIQESQEEMIPPTIQPINDSPSMAINLDEEEEISPMLPPVIELPDEGISGDLEDEFVSESSETINVPVTTNFDVLEVDVIASSTPGYIYFDGKLKLYGDFKGAKYEILEINSNEGRNVYLYCKNIYYRIQTTSVKSDLQPLNQTDLIADLELIRDSKQ